MRRERKAIAGIIMDFIINGGRPLSGSVNIQCAKNSVLPVLAASVLAEDPVTVTGCPEISDVMNMAEILRECGVFYRFKNGDLILTPKNSLKDAFSEKIASRIRTSVLMLGALSGRTGRAVIPLPGGCDIGKRPIDIHINAFKELGAAIREQDGKVICLSPIRGGKTVFPFPSVGATENVMIGAARADGETVICNAAREPEIVDLANFLKKAGAKISGAGTSVVKIEGVKRLRGTDFKPSSDRIEAGTFLIAGAITGGEVELRGVKAENLYTLIGKLCDNTCNITIKNDIIYLRGGKRRKKFSFTTGPYPMFPTDLQAQATSLAAVSEGVSVINERVFENRFYHAAELCRMGAKIKVKGRKAIVTGVLGLHGAEVFAHDLRCGAALVLAGLNAEGVTVVKDIEHLERGYCDLDKKLAALGGDVVRKE